MRALRDEATSWDPANSGRVGESSTGNSQGSLKSRPPLYPTRLEGAPILPLRRTAPDGGHRGAVNAPGSQGRSWCARILNPEGESAYANDEPFTSRIANRVIYGRPGGHSVGPM